MHLQIWGGSGGRKGPIFPCAKCGGRLDLWHKALSHSDPMVTATYHPENRTALAESEQNFKTAYCVEK